MAIEPKKLALVRTSFKHVGFERLGTFVLPPKARAEREALAAALCAEEVVYLATCNRIECYLALEGRPDSSRLVQAARSFFRERGTACHEDDFEVLCGAAAIEHLFSMASSLDSLVVGESDIVRQVREAAERADEEGLAGPILARLFERAARCARRVHGETKLSETHVSVATLAVSKIRKHFGKDGPGVSVLVGVGDMTRKVAKALQHLPGERIYVNRTAEGAEEFARLYNGRPLALDAFVRQPPEWIDLIFTATSAPAPVITAEALGPALAAREAAGGPPLIVCDMGVPRDVDPSLEGQAGLLLVALEHLELLARMNRARLEEEVARARRVVSEEAIRLLREERFRRLADESTSAILQSRLGHLEESDREAILRFAAGLAERFARQPDPAEDD